MKRMIKLSSNNKNTYKQRFLLFTEEFWKTEKQNHPKNMELFFSGKKNEFYIAADDQMVTYFIGLGKDKSDGFQLQDVGRAFSQKHRENLLSESTQISGVALSEAQLDEFIKGLFLGTYSYPFKKEHPFWKKGFELHHQEIDQTQLDSISTQVEALCNGQFTAMDWLNKPANLKNADLVSHFLKKMAKDKNLKYTVFNRKKCEELGLGAYLSVNQASSFDAAFTILEYQSGVKNAKTVGLVGKCVLFDTGGISIKGSQNMHYMKSDMGGATAVIGTLIAASELALPVNLVAILPITDNVVSRDAFLPSDVVKAYNGKTIEVLNTDAEGRMTLADGLSYLAKNYKTDVLLDLATLTGSSVRMFGDTCGALFSNNDELKNQLISSGDETNQRLWNLPLWDIWKEDINSDVADLKNISLKPIGDAIVAAKFLEQFIEEHPSWAHLDIAGVAFGNVNYAKEKAATGYGVQLLLNFLRKMN